MVKTLKKVLCSMLTLALMVTMFAGSTMEVRAEEAETVDFQYEEAWAIANTEPWESQIVDVTGAKIGDTIALNIKSKEGLVYDHTIVFDTNLFTKDGNNLVINALPEAGADPYYIVHVYVYAEEEEYQYFHYGFSNVHKPGEPYLDVKPSKFPAEDIITGADIWADVLEKFSGCNVVEIYTGKNGNAEAPVDREEVIAGGTQLAPKDIYVERDCDHSETPSGGSCGSTESAPAQEPASEPEQEVVQTPENNYRVFHEVTIKNVEKAIEVATANAVQAATTGKKATTEPVKIDTGVWISFKGDVYQKLQDSGLPVQITFMYKGERYRVDIPAGADLMSLVDENGYCGFLNLMAHFGGTKL